MVGEVSSGLCVVGKEENLNQFGVKSGGGQDGASADLKLRLRLRLSSKWP